MIVLTLTRPWLLVGYRALGRKWASSGLVRGIGEAVTQASAGAALGRPGAPFGRPGADRRMWGGQTDVGRARRPTPLELREPVRVRESSLERPPRQDPPARLRTTSAHNHSRRTHMSGLPKHTEAQNAPPTENTSSIRFVHSLRAHRGDPKIFCIEPFKTGSPGYIGETPLSRAADSASFRSRSLT